MTETLPHSGDFPTVLSKIADHSTPVVKHDPAELPISQQTAIDEIDEASMESFPCSDPPGYTMSHS